MAKPPQPSIPTTANRAISYFELLAIRTAEVLKGDGIILNFRGYKETIDAYSELNENNGQQAWELARDLNVWSEYFSDIANLIQKLYLDADTEKTETIAIASFEADEKRVTHGERLANKDERVINIRKKRNTLQAFYDALLSKIKFLERAHYHCKATAESKIRFMNSQQQNRPYYNSSYTHHR